MTITPSVKVAGLVHPGVELLNISEPTEVFSNVLGVQVCSKSGGATRRP